MSPPPGSPTGPLWRGPFWELSITHLSESQVKHLPIPGSPNRTPQVPQWVHYGERCPFSEPSFTHSLIKKFTLLSKSLVKEPPLRVPLWRKMLCLQSQWLINLYLSHEIGGKCSHRPQSPMWTGLHTMGCGLVPQGDRLWHYHYPSAVQPPAWYLPLWLG